MMMTEAKIGEQLVRPLKFRAVVIRFEVVKVTSEQTLLPIAVVKEWEGLGTPIT